MQMSLKQFYVLWISNEPKTYFTGQDEGILKPVESWISESLPFRNQKKLSY